MAPDMSADQSTPQPDSSRRIYVCWAVGLAFLAAMGLFCWLVVRPVVETKAVIAGVYGQYLARHAGQDCFDAWAPPEDVDLALQRLGGPKEALRRLGLYVRLPESVAPCKILAVQVLARCGKEAVPALVKVVRNDEGIDIDAVDAAADALGDLGTEARAAIPVLADKLKRTGIRDDHDGRIDDALKKLRVEEPPSPPGDAPKAN